MSINNEHPSTVFYGYHDVNSQKADDQGFVTGVNVVNALSYIPGISVIVGIVRIIFAAMIMSQADNDEERKAMGLQILRGFVEILCAGIFYSIPDIIITANRYDCCQSNSDHDAYGFQAVHHQTGEDIRTLKNNEIRQQIEAMKRDLGGLSGNGLQSTAF